MRALILECENLVADADEANGLAVLKNDTGGDAGFEIF